MSNRKCRAAVRNKQPKENAAGIDLAHPISFQGSCQECLRHNPPLLSTTLLINLNTINQPIRINKRPRVIRHKIRTRRRLTRTTATAPNIARPVTTESSVEHDIVVLEMLVNVAAVAGEFRLWCAPR